MFGENTFAQHKGISFQAVLKKPDGTYPTVSGLSVTLQILDPVSDCVLREEVHSGVNISNGYINLVLGAASATTPAGRNPITVLTIPQVMDNATVRTGLNCVDANNNIASSGQTYTPAATHPRKLRLRAVVGGDTVVADFNMRSVAFAVNAENLDGKTSGQFVQTSTATTQANVESVFSRYAILDAILSGTYAGNAATATALASAPGACPAGQYMSAMTAAGAITCSAPAGSVTAVSSANLYLSVATGTSTPVLTVNVGTAANTVAAGNDARFTDSRAPTGAAGGDLSGTYPNPGVAKIAGKSVVLTTPASGEFLKYDGTNFVNSAISTADATKLPLAGGTMSGAIDMGSQNLTNVGYVTMATGKSLHLSNNASDPAGLVAADKGKLWFNSTSGQVKYWDGAAAQPLGVAGSGLQTFNGMTGTTQTLAIGTSGTAPAWSSVTDTHTLNIPMASTAAVTAGLLSKTDYDAFTAKLGTASAFSGDVTGTSSTTSVDKIKGKAITAGAYAVGQTLRYDGTAWINAVLGFADLGSKPTTLAGYGITDAQSSTLADGKILVGNGSNVATAVSLSGDATLANTGAITLATVPITKGGTGLTSFTGDKVITTSAAGALQASSCGLNQVISYTAGGAITCAALTAGTVTSVTAGTGLNVGAGPGGSITSTGTLNVDSASANTASKIVARDVSGDFAAGAITNNSNILKGSTAGALTMTVPATVTPYSLTWPGAVGGAGTFLTTDASGNLSWGSPAAIADSSYAAKGAVQFLTDAATSGLTVAAGVASVNAGTGANQLVKLDGSSKLPAIDGSALTNLNAGNIATGTLPVARGGTAATSFTADKMVVANGTGSALQSFNCAVGEYLTFTAGGAATCGNATTGTGFVNNGNSFGAAATLGTNDAQSLNFETNNTTQMTILSGGNVGIGNTNPGAPLHIGATNGFSVFPNWGGSGELPSAGTLLGSYTGNLSFFASAYDGAAGAKTVFGYYDGTTNRSALEVANVASGFSNLVMMKSGGKVGIGTPSPNTALDVNGTVAVNSSVESVSTYVNSGAAYTIADTSVNARQLTLDNNTTVTLPAFTSPAGKMYSLTVFLKQDGTGSRTVTFAGNGADTIKWDSGAAPTISPTAGKITILQFMKLSSETVWYGSMVWKEN